MRGSNAPVGRVLLCISARAIRIWRATRELALAFDKAGVDILELGVPFSDPLADGLVNQLAAQRGLASGTTPPRVMATVAAIRKHSKIPIILYIYFNLIHRVGLERFIQDAAKAGVDGLLVLDLPPEESDNYEALMRKNGLCHIYLVAPTTPEDRMEFIVKRGSGFIYYISREGVTGMQKQVASNLAQQVAKIHAHTKLPVAVGFGISTPEQAEARRAKCGRRRRRQRGGEPDCGIRQVEGFGEAREQVCEIAGGCGEKYLITVDEHE